MLICIVFLNAILLLYSMIRTHLDKGTSSREYDGLFHKRFVLVRQGAEEGYLNNPLTRPYVLTGDYAVIELSITNTEFIVRTYCDNGYTNEHVYVIGEDIYYIGNGKFVYYETWLNIGQLLPGTNYSHITCEIYIQDNYVSINAMENQAGMALFLVPIINKRTYNRIIKLVMVSGNGVSNGVNSNI